MHIAQNAKDARRVPDEVFARAVSRIEGVEAAFLDDSREMVRLYVIARDHSSALQRMVNRAEDEILERCPGLDLDVYVRATQGNASPESLAIGRRLAL